MNFKLLGGILLVIGTTIGAGMLALPVATAQLGFWGSMALLIGCWGVMTTCAFIFLEVNLWLPSNSNTVSMAGATLGVGGQVVAWVANMILLYSILAAYMAGGGDLFHYVLASAGITIPVAAASILFTVLFGVIVYLGIRSVDYVNRGLMFGKMGALVILICLILPFVSAGNLAQGEFKYIIHPTSITVTAVAFASLMIIPSLRTYFDGDIKALRTTILVGTFIPLLCYIGWDMVIMGVIPFEGIPGLKQIMSSSSSNSDLVSALTSIIRKETVTTLAKFFTSICMATSFLSVSLSLADFLSDGLGVKKQGLAGNATIMGLTFLPPLLVVLFNPSAFLVGIEYAGLCCFVLMIVLPALMAWRGRSMPAFAKMRYNVPGGNILLLGLAAFGLILLAMSGLKGQVALGLLLVTFVVAWVLRMKQPSKNTVTA